MGKRKQGRASPSDSLERLIVQVRRDFGGKSTRRAELQARYGLDRVVSEELVTRLEALEYMHFFDYGMIHGRDRGFRVVPVATPDPPKGETPEQAARRKKMENLFRIHGTGVCFRCGAEVPGLSQAKLESRGHTRKDCDLQIAKDVLER
jgi:hypothetical protein